MEKTLANSQYASHVDDGSPFLLIEGLSRKFGALTAVDDVSFEVPPKEIFSIIGPNGAGKTTLFNVMTGIFPATQGKIIFKGKDITNLEPHVIAELGIARTFQIVRLFDKMSVLENTTVGFHCRIKSNVGDVIFNTRRIRDEKLELRRKGMELLETVGLSDYRDTIARNLPLGLRKRLQIARALATNPSILLLDEPSGGMNPTEKVKMMDLIKYLKESGLTVLLVEHDMNVIMEISDRIIVLDHGIKIAEGTPREIQDNERVIEAYLGKGLKNALIRN